MRGLSGTGVAGGGAGAGVSADTNTSMLDGSVNGVDAAGVNVTAPGSGSGGQVRFQDNKELAEAIRKSIYTRKSLV